jgi:hypothetical protein
MRRVDRSKFEFAKPASVNLIVRHRIIMPIVGLALALLLAWIGILVLRHRRLKAAIDLAFSRVYANWSPLPELKISYSYGYPAFRVTFKSKLDMNAAAEAGLNTEFFGLIGELCKDFGTKRRPFRADAAVFFTYQGYINDVRRRLGLKVDADE